MRLICSGVAAALLCAATVPLFAADSKPLRTGKDALGDWTTDAPGVRRKITSDNLPPPDPRESVYNSPRIVAPPPKAQLRVPMGFQVEQIASGFRNPRFLLSAPNGDIFVTESHVNQIKILHAENGVIRVELFADSGLNDPFGTAFYPPGDDPPVSLCCEYKWRCPFSISKRRSACARAGPETRCGTFGRRSSARWWALDAGYRLCRRWQQNVCLDRVALE